MYHLVLGGARSGKSRYAESLAEQSGLPVMYVATAQARDQEMRERIEQHQADRPDHWHTREIGTELGDLIRAERRPHQCIMVDCLTLWMMSLLEADNIESAVDDVLDALNSTEGPIVMVSNEITMGVVPMGELSRRYVDELGRLHQRIAAQCENVTLMVAGIPHPIK